MTTLIIIGCVLAYLAIGVLTTLAFMRSCKGTAFDEDDLGYLVGCAIFWPMPALFLVFYWFGWLILALHRLTKGGRK